MITRIASFLKASMGVLVIGFIVSFSSCAVDNPRYQRRNDTGLSDNRQKNRAPAQGGLNRAPDERGLNRPPGQSAFQGNNQDFKGPYKPVQDNHQNSRPPKDNDRGAGLGDFIGWLIGGLLSLFSGNR
jgi:hypothetical protein